MSSGDNTRTSYVRVSPRTIPYQAPWRPWKRGRAIGTSAALLRSRRYTARSRASGPAPFVATAANVTSSRSGVSATTTMSVTSATVWPVFTRLTGVLMEGDLDRAAAMMHDGLVRYIPPSACVSRDAEVAAVRRDKDFFAIENGEITLKRNDVDVATDFKLQQAFTRRGLAFDRVGLVTFSIHERLVRSYFFLASRAALACFKNWVGTLPPKKRENRPFLFSLSRSCRPRGLDQTNGRNGHG